MTMWLIRAGSKSYSEDLVLSNHCAAIDFNFNESLLPLSFENIKQKLVAYNPSIKSGAIGQTASMLYKIAHVVKQDDWVIFPARYRDTYHIGTIQGDYSYFDRSNIQDSHGDYLKHTVPVKWHDFEIDKNELTPTIRNSLGSTLSLFLIKPDDEDYIVSMFNSRNSDLELRNITSAQLTSDEVPAKTLISKENLTGIIYDHIYNTFKGHQLTDLVSALLSVQGFHCYQSPPGPDGGVDIIAGHGSFGFQSPKVCVQVKSGKQITDVKPIRELEGSLSRFQAAYGLFVSWSGFTIPATRLLKERFLTIRFWTGENIVEQVLQHYQNLPISIRQQVPLEQCWMLLEIPS
jgi:restriction system protein